MAVLPAHHRFERFLSLYVRQHALEHHVERHGGERLQDLMPVGVVRASWDPKDGVQMVLGPLLVKGEERVRFARKHGEGRHAGSGERNLSIRRAISWEMVKTNVNQLKKRIGRERFASFRGNKHSAHLAGRPRIIPKIFCSLLTK